MRASILLLFSVLLAASSADAKVFHSKASALGAAFPGATEVVEKTLYLSSDDAAWIKRTAGVEWPGRVVRTYVGYSGRNIVGYGFIDTHKIRTLNQTVMVVVSPDGRVKEALVLAFHEPIEYGVPTQWWSQVVGRRLDPSLSLRKDIDGVTGATMTARTNIAVTRRILAIYERKIAGRALARSK